MWCFFLFLQLEDVFFYLIQKVFLAKGDALHLSYCITTCQNYTLRETEMSFKKKHNFGDSYVLGYDAALLGKRLLIFWRNVLPSSWRVKSQLTLDPSKLKLTQSSETLGTAYTATQPHTPEDQNLHICILTYSASLTIFICFLFIREDECMYVTSFTVTSTAILKTGFIWVKRKFIKFRWHLEWIMLPFSWVDFVLQFLVICGKSTHGT